MDGRGVADGGPRGLNVPRAGTMRRLTDTEQPPLRTGHFASCWLLSSTQALVVGGFGL